MTTTRKVPADPGTHGTSLAANQLAEPTPSQPPSAPVTTKAKTEAGPNNLVLNKESITARIVQPLSASGSKKGDRVEAQIIEPHKFRNALIEGEITKSKAAGKANGKSELAFSFNRIIVADKEIPISADLLGIQNSQGQSDVDEEGHIIAHSSKQKNVVRTGILAGIGAVIGGLAGGKKGAATGAAIGAAVGLTVAFTTKGEDIRLAPNSTLLLSVSTQNVPGEEP